MNLAVFQESFMVTELGGSGGCIVEKMALKKLGVLVRWLIPTIFVPRRPKLEDPTSPRPAQA